MAIKHTLIYNKTILSFYGTLSEEHQSSAEHTLGNADLLYHEYNCILISPVLILMWWLCVIGNTFCEWRLSAGSDVAGALE